MPFQRVVWYHNTAPVNFSNSRIVVAKNGMLLYIDNVSKDDAGDYIYVIHKGKAVFRRYGNLQVTEDIFGCQLNSSCCKIYNHISLMFYLIFYLMQHLIVDGVVQESRLWQKEI